MTIVEKIQNKIKNTLRQIASEEQVRILYACESGSRAWGFASPDSDYDVRFIYLRQTDDYLRLHRKRDVIERPISDELDVSGWDLGKALLLLRKSNPPLLEWLKSPIIYTEEKKFSDAMRSLATDFYSPVSCRYHYLHMAELNFREYLRRDIVRTKKYFYVLRPVLACRWIERDLGLVPMEFDLLLEHTVDDKYLRKAIHHLLEIKKQVGEMADGPQIPEISSFLENEIPRLREVLPAAPTKPDGERLEVFFQTMLKTLNG
jgi:predicted nucleotidyltransferase